MKNIILLLIIIVCCISFGIVLLPGIKSIDPVRSVVDGNSTIERCPYDASVIYDNLGIPSYDYGTVEGVDIGLQRSAITIANEALRFYEEDYQRSIPKNETAKRFFLNNADWLVKNIAMTNHNRTFTYATYEYQFEWPYYDLIPPWRDAMTQGRAVEALVGASELTGDRKYLHTAKQIINSFFIEVKDGGVTYKSPDRGWWYEHYADNDKRGKQEPRVLNAMAFALLGVHRYYNYTSDESARFLFEQGITALKNDLPKYDDNGNSFYDALGTKAGNYYLPFHIKLLSDLYAITGDPIFKKYHDAWGEDFILDQFSGRSLGQVYHDPCINKRGLFRIQADLDNSNGFLNLLEPQNMNWSTLNEAETIQNNSGLNILVDTDKKIKSYNRAFLQITLNLPDLQKQNTQPDSLLLNLKYLAKSMNGSASFIGHVIDISNRTGYPSSFSFPLTTNGQEHLTNETIVIPKSFINKPVEFRIYIITAEPGTHSLFIKEARLLSDVTIQLSNIP